MSILRKLDVLVAAEKAELQDWRKHADVVKDIIWSYMFEDMDLATQVRIKQRIWAIYGNNMRLHWDLQGSQPHVTVHSELFGHRKITFFVWGKK